MFSRRVPHLIGLAGLALGGWIGYTFYCYFTHDVAPTVAIVGIAQGSSHKGQVACTLKAENGYKVAHVSTLLDHKPFEPLTKRLKGKVVAAPFTLDTTQLSDGPHLLELEVTDGSYRKNSSKEQLDFFVDNQPLQAALLSSDFKVDQGNTVHVQIQCNKQIAQGNIKFLNNSYACCPSSEDSTVYDCYLPVDCEEESTEQLLKVELVDAVGNAEHLTAQVHIRKVEFPKQKGFTVPAEKLEEEKEISVSNKILQEALEKWVKDSPRKKLWKGPFEVPTVAQRIVTPYGEVRTTPERGRYLHKAIDVVNIPRGVTWASNDGRVIIKDRYLMSGNTIVLDHGMGIFTLYYHLDTFADLEVGDLVRKGNPIGRIGKTGYATGYHLHWALTINNQPVNPLEWTTKRIV